MKKRIDSLLPEALIIQDQLIEWRRHFHQHPETGLEVAETASYIRKILKNLDIPILENTPGHTVIGMLKGLDSQNPLGLRADMDALEIPENTGLPYASLRENTMHACGHDAHMAMLLGAAVLLAQWGGDLPQDTYFIFQPGEEDPGGALPIMNSGVLKPLKGIFGIHMDPIQPCGTGGINSDKAMASTDCFHIELTGIGGHAALPHQSVDPIAIAAQVINSLQFIVSRLLDPVEPAVLTLGSIKGGYRPNVIPDSVSISGTFRTFSESIRKQIQEEIRKTLEMYCTRYGATFSLDIIPGYPPVINTPEMCDFVLETSAYAGTALEIRELEKPRMAGEDFSYYLQEIPGAFYWLGCRNEETLCSFPLHHSRFNLDENALPLGTAMHCLCALNFPRALTRLAVSHE
ncbi:M20 family metallopeptidase [Oceanispirochaeta sp.]|jgi:amidohydrolase|uniref:M20 metallopeptidase family protein n=1 Tax=Oceanispirochaeta sp. TaxID=2035350 RepID=UPI002612087D|nr:amidohydrolase [Oceanispirochaeta sp.]MDA3957315.1 amidohydrolase [Oceanispirochaeta sp.]